VWSPPERKNFDDFRARLRVLLARFDRLGVNYRRPRDSATPPANPMSPPHGT